MDNNKNLIQLIKDNLNAILDAVNENYIELNKSVENLKKENQELKEIVEELSGKIEKISITPVVPIEDKNLEEFLFVSKEDEQESDPKIEQESNIKTEQEPEKVEEFIAIQKDSIPDIKTQIEQQLKSQEQIEEEEGPESMFELDTDSLSEDGTLAVEAQEESGDLFSQSTYEENQTPKILNDAIKPDWQDWEVDYPAPYLDDIMAGISFNDRIMFLRELFNSDDQQFKSTIEYLNQLSNFKSAVTYLRREFPQWNESSNEVYRFYMNVRRKLRS